MIEKFLNKAKDLIAHNKIIILICTLITVIFVPGLFNIKFDNEIINMLPKTNRDVQEHYKYEKIFGDSSPIFVGIETDNVYNKDYLNYLIKLINDIEALNKKLPPQNLSKLFKITPEEANEIISVISESGAINAKDIKQLLSDKKKLIDDFFLDEKLAEKISKRVKKINEIDILRDYTLPIKEIRSIINIDYIKGEKDKFKVEKVFDGEEVKEKDIPNIKNKIDSWPLYKGFIISEDETLSNILIQLNGIGLGNKGKVYEEVLELTQKSPYKVYIGGEPVVTYSIGRYIRKDLVVLIPLVCIVVIAILFLSFGNFQGVVFPLLSVALSAVWTVGLMSYLGVSLNIVCTVIPVMLIAVGSAYGIHFMNNYFLNSNKDKITVLNQNINTIGISIFLAGITTIAGFGSLVTAGFKPLKNFGIFTSIGILFGIFISLFLISSLLLLGKKEKTIFFKETKKHDLITKMLEKFGYLSVEKNKIIILLSFILVFIFAFGIFKIKVEMNEIEFFKNDSDIRVVDKILNEKMSGTQNLDIILETKDETSILKKEVLQEVEKFCVNITQKFPKIKKVFYLNEYLKKMNKEIYGGKPKHYVLPESDEKIKDYMLLYSGKIDSVVTDNKDKIRITLIMKRGSTSEIAEIKKYSMNYFKKIFSNNNNIVNAITGYADLYIVSNHIITYSMINSLVVSLLIVFFINYLSFKRLRITFISLIPILITLIITFGLMGYLGITLNAGTSMIAGVAIGIGIDYPIHYLVRYLMDRKYKGKKEAAKAATNEIGRGIIYNVLSVAAGFFVISVSKFIPLVQFGVLVSFVMILTGIGALLLVPAFLMVFDKN